MAGIVNGSIELGGLAQRLTETPTPIKYLWIQTPIENKGVVFIGSWREGESLDHIANADPIPPGPAVAPGVDKEFTFRHDAKEAPCNLSDIFVVGKEHGDVISYLAITT